MDSGRGEVSTMKMIKPCTNCGYQNGWFEKIQHSYEQYYDENGEATHAADSGRAKGRGGRRKYCYECRTDITRLVVEDDHALHP